MSIPISTSLDAWCKVKNKLTCRQIQVLHTIEKYPNHTNSELSKIMRIPLQSVTPRTGELLNLGKIKRVERRACSVTGGNSWTMRVVVVV